MKIVLGRVHQMRGLNGGMENVCARMANEMIKRGHDVTVISDDPDGGMMYFQYDESTHFVNLADYGEEKAPVWQALFKVMRELARPVSKGAAMSWKNRGRALRMRGSIQRALEEANPDVIVSFEASSSALFLDAMGKNHLPLVTMFHFPTAMAVNWDDPQERQALLDSDVVQVLMNADIDSLKKRLPKARAFRIPNAVPQYSKEADPGKERTRHTIIDVARLTREQKQPHVLITAFSLLAKEFPDWDLEFWGVDPGDGSYQKYLSDLVGKLGLNDRVFFRGVTTDVLSVYLNSDIFAIPSSFEGFGLAMTEAMSAGLPAVGFKSCDAVNEIIRDEVSGFLTDDGPEAYAEALRKLMADPMLRKKMGHAAKLEMEEFSPERVWDEWEKLLSKLVQNKKQ